LWNSLRAADPRRSTHSVARKPMARNDILLYIVFRIREGMDRVGSAVRSVVEGGHAA
jgi:hypothetical protein